MDELTEEDITQAIKNILRLCDEWKESERDIEASIAFVHSVEDVIINDLEFDEL